GVRRVQGWPLVACKGRFELASGADTKKQTAHSAQRTAHSAQRTAHSAQRTANAALALGEYSVAGGH
ncbi:unnamed protein product, partial [Ceratitis capitata]